MRRARLILVLLGIALTAACSPAPREVGVDDPNETQNREIHQFNRGLDRVLVRPASTGYGTVLPAPVRRGISNFASNLNMPGTVLNDLLQFRIEDAGHNTFRFLVNSTFGLGGLLDPATAAGLDNRTSDFGETLYVWGAPEGGYVELPFVGPSTSRHTAGRVVDIMINPLNFVLIGTERTVSTTSAVAARLGDRYQYSDFVDQVLYESEDSYAQAQLLYLQNRRFRLSGDQEEFFDPYEDVYGEE